MRPNWTAVDYYPVKLNRHAILIAEGLPAESYSDTGNSGFFENSGAPMVLHPDLTDETDYPTREAGSCAPFVWDEASVRPARQCLVDRAAAIGQPVPKHTTTADAGLRLFASKRRTIKPIYGDSNVVIFMLPRGVPVRSDCCHARSRRPRHARGSTIVAGLACGWRTSCCVAWTRCAKFRLITPVSQKVGGLLNVTGRCDSVAAGDERQRHVGTSLGRVDDLCPGSRHSGSDQASRCLTELARIDRAPTSTRGECGKSSYPTLWATPAFQVVRGPSLSLSQAQAMFRPTAGETITGLLLAHDPMRPSKRRRAAG